MKILNSIASLIIAAAPTAAQFKVKSSDGFELTHPLSGTEGNSAAAAAVNIQAAAGGSKKIIVRLDRGRGSKGASRRRAGRDALLAAASKGKGKMGVYVDRSYDVGDNDRKGGLLKDMMAAEVPVESIPDLIASGLFEVVEEDFEVNILGWPDNDGNSLDESHRRLTEEVPWGIPFTEADQVPGNPNRIKVCVADTGFANGHEDLPFCARDDPSCKDIVDGTDAYGEYWNYDGHGHGTHCSGTVGAIGNNDKGIVGVFNSSADWLLQVGKALSAEGYGSSAGVLAAVENCVLAGAKVISMSLGCDDCYLQQADDFYTDLYLNGDILIIAAAGNSGPANNVKSYPASYKAVVSVAAISSSNKVASFSQVNDQVEIAAPGVGITSTIPGGQNNEGAYATWSGTSMATPHVAAIAAKVWSHFPECSNYQIRNALAKSAVYPGHENETYCDWYRGYGNVRAKAMYDLLNENGCGAGGFARYGNNTATGNLMGGCYQVYETVSPTASPAPSRSSQPSGIPSVSPTLAPTVSRSPSAAPSLSSAPSTAQPTDVPSTSPAPSSRPSLAPTFSPTESREVVTSPPTYSINIQHGTMFHIKAKANITIYNIDISLYTTAPANVTIWTRSGGSFWRVRNRKTEWENNGIVYGLRGTGYFADKVTLPRHSFAPINVEAGATHAFYITLPPDDVTNRISMDNLGTNPLNGVWFENEYLTVYEGIYKDHWMHSSPNTLDVEQSYNFIGSFYVVPEGTLLPTASPTMSSAPSASEVPSFSPSTLSPTSSAAPTGVVNTLTTSEEGSSYESANGIMFDVVNKGNFPLRILSFGVNFRVDNCTFQLYTKGGTHYLSYEDQSAWNLNGQGTLKRAPYPSKTKLPVRGQVTINQGESIAFYIAFLDCSGKWPLAVDRGENYTFGAWVEDDHIAMMEGMNRRFPLTWDNPFGVGDDYPCGYLPDGCSHSMRGSSINYETYEAVRRSLPSMHPSLNPSLRPSLSPSRSFGPSGSPTSSPNNMSSAPSSLPSSMPSLSSSQPSVQPSSKQREPSNQPSSEPSLSLLPSESPSSEPNDKPASQPSSLPTESSSWEPSSVSLSQPSLTPTRSFNPSYDKKPSSSPSKSPQPSVQKSAQPSFWSSSKPSVQPSGQPSVLPSLIPSLEPSGVPSSIPSSIPSESPLTQPSFMPSLQPSLESSDVPSSMPSSIPSKSPSSQPSLMPSESPNSQPSTRPSFQPTSKPSLEPSSQSSLKPSVTPSKGQSSKPSCEPSSQPSSLPTESSSWEPSSVSSSQPSSMPSESPSMSSATIGPTPDPTPAPSNAPTRVFIETIAPQANTYIPAKGPEVGVKKYVCNQSVTNIAEICLEGSLFPDATCSSAKAACGDKGRICHVVTCPSAPGRPIHAMCIKTAVHTAQTRYERLVNRKAKLPALNKNKNHVSLINY